MGKTLLHVSCIDQRLVVVSPPVIASGGKNEDLIVFDFCPLWDGFSKTAVFYRDASDPYHAVVTDDQCIVPWEVLQTDGFVYFGVAGVKGDTTRTTEVIRYRVTAGALTEGTKPSDPTPDIYEQILAQVAGVHTRMAQIEENISGQPYEATGGMVQSDNFEGMPMKCVTHIEPVQAGSGSPSPDNVRPIAEFASVKRVHCGKNLLLNEGYTQTKNGVTFTFNADGSVTMKGTATDNTTVSVAGTSSDYSYHLPAGNYVFSGCENGAGETYFMKLRSAEKNPVAMSAHGEDAFTHDGAPLWCYIYVVSGVTVDATLYPMVRHADDADGTYEPFQGDVLLEDTGSAICGGTLDWNTGVLTVDKMLITLTGAGSAKLTNESSNAPNFYYALGIANACQTHDNYGAPPYGISSHYTAGTWTEAKSDPTIFGVSPTGGIGIYYEGTMAEANAWLASQNAAGTPVQFVLNLKTPAVIQLTPAQITALQGVNNIWCDAGDTTVSGRKDILWLTSSLLQRIQTLEATLAALEAAALSE